MGVVSLVSPQLIFYADLPYIFVARIIQGIGLVSSFFNLLYISNICLSIF